MSRHSYTSSGTSEWLLGALKQNPEGLLLLAAGAALLLRKSGAFTGPALGRATTSVNRAANYGGHEVADAASGAKNYAADIAGRTMDKASSFASSASAAASDAGRAVGAQSERIIQQAQSSFQGTMDRVLKDQPLFVAIAGIAAGAALAATFPATDFEKQNLGPIGDQVSDAAGRLGEQLKEATAKAGESLKTAAEGRGLSADGLKEVAAEVAGAFSGSMGGEEQKSASSNWSSNPSNPSSQSGPSTRSGPSGHSG